MEKSEKIQIAAFFVFAYGVLYFFVAGSEHRHLDAIYTNAYCRTQLFHELASKGNVHDRLAKVIRNNPWVSKEKGVAIFEYNFYFVSVADSYYEYKTQRQGNVVEVTATPKSTPWWRWLNPNRMFKIQGNKVIETSIFSRK